MKNNYDTVIAGSAYQNCHDGHIENDFFCLTFFKKEIIIAIENLVGSADIKEVCRKRSTDARNKTLI